MLKKIVVYVLILYYRITHKILSLFSTPVFVVSDSHSLINPYIYSHLKSSDYIIHAGDWSDIEVYNDLKNITDNLYAVRGNTETNKIDNILPETLNFELFNKNIVVKHEIYNLKLWTQDNKKKVDIIIHGHTHKPFKKKINGITIYNPGSCGPKRFRNTGPSYGIIYFFKNKFLIRTFYIPFQSHKGYY